MIMIDKRRLQLEQKYYNLNDTAQLLGLKVRTARNWVVNGKIAAVKQSGTNHWAVPETSILEFVDAVEPHYGSGQVARLLCVSTRAVVEMIKRGKIEGKQARGTKHWIVPVREVERIMGEK
jgi:predicted site-specific integrase-resolvase